MFMFTKRILLKNRLLLKTPSFGKKDGVLERGIFLKNTEVLKKHGIRNGEFLKTRKF